MELSELEVAKPHSVKKFELVSKYAEDWAMHLLNLDACHEIVLIDCMANRGIYKSVKGEIIEGTPLRTAKKIYDIMKEYPQKKAILYFNDLDESKIGTLRETLSNRGICNTRNFRIVFSTKDANCLLKELSTHLYIKSKISYLLFYDPYQASIDWDALTPYLNYWGEVIINHMVSDTVRAIKTAKRADKVAKYERTYEEDIEKLVTQCSDKKDYESIIHKIIERKITVNGEKVYIASFPFFNRKNGLVFNIIHCTKHIHGFNLFKKDAWKTFGGQSSDKNTHGEGDLFSFDFDASEPGAIKIESDEFCYTISDISFYIIHHYQGKGKVPLKKIWELLSYHPIFPNEGFRPEIKRELKKYGFKEVKYKNTGNYIDFGAKP